MPQGNNWKPRVIWPHSFPVATLSLRAANDLCQSPDNFGSKKKQGRCSNLPLCGALVPSPPPRHRRQQTNHFTNCPHLLPRLVLHSHAQTIFDN